MKIKRTIPPTAAPVPAISLLHGIAGIICGRQVLANLENGLKADFGVKHVYAVSSGKAALTIILTALKVLYPERDKVVIPAYTCFSVPSAIVKSGLKVIPCDIDASTLDFDIKRLGEMLDHKTLCVIPSHLFGIPSKVDEIKELCGNYGISVVEDAAQAMGVEYNNRKLGTLADVGFFSLGRGKNVTCGSGGIILTNSDSLAAEIERKIAMIKPPSALDDLVELLKLIILSIFIRPSLYWFPAGIPSLKLGETIFYKDFPIKKLSGMQAGILKDWRNRLTESNRARRENALYFRKALGNNNSSLDDSLCLLRLPVIAESSQEKERIYSLSKKKGLGLSKMYPTPVNEIEEIKGMFVGMEFPNARMISERLLNIPTHQLLSPNDKSAIVELIKKSASSLRLLPLKHA